MKYPMSVDKFTDSFLNLAPGQSMVYHTGFLSMNREGKSAAAKQLRATALLVLQYGTDKGRPLNPHDAKNKLIGLGLGLLTQRKPEKGKYEYLITRRSPQAFGQAA